MRKILFLALAVPLFACAPDAGTGVSPNTANQGNPDRALRAAQPGSGQNVGGGAARVTGDMGEGRPTIERGPAPRGSGGGCPPGTRPVTLNNAMGDRPTVECR